MANTDELVVSLRSFKYNNVSPNLDAAAFVAPNAVVTGDVRLGHRSSLFYGAQLRGDHGPVRIGDKCFIGDNSRIGLLNHAHLQRTGSNPLDDLSSSDMTASDRSDGSEDQSARSRGNGVTIMDNVTIGFNVLIEDDVVIGNNCVVGSNAVLKAGTVLEPHSVVGGGSIVWENTTVPTGQVWAGKPAKFIRDLHNEERGNHMENVNEYVDLGLCHAYETEKSWIEQLADIE